VDRKTASFPSPSDVIQLDVAIVGSGPAGASAALALAGSGLRVGIIEKAELPRHKTCGGGVLHRAATMLPLDLGDVVEWKCHSAELVHHAPDLRFVCTRPAPVVSMVMRDRFDQLLTQTAVSRGAYFYPNATVQDVVARENEVRLTTTNGQFHARFVIAADGVNSVIARKTGRAELRGVVPALECEVTLPPGADERWKRSARFDFGFVPAGYAWVFPKKNHLSIGVLTTRRGAANLPEYYRKYRDALGIRDVVREERHGYMIPCRPRSDLFSLERVMFVGDAAGLVDPVTAEGITAAILSGQLAAQAIIEARTDVQRVQSIYRGKLEEKLLADLRVARRLATILYEWPRLRGKLFSRQGQRLSDAFTQIVMGEHRYTDLVGRPKNYLKILFG
jgi:geranylgeranyl reductase family protein